jgi:RsiW-degrading membrane proteinase PrsW (M82 family)
MDMHHCGAVDHCNNRLGDGMTWRNLIGIFVSGIVLGLVVIAVIRVPVLDAAADEKQQRYQEAKMKARLFTKFSDSAIAQMSEPVSTTRDKK